MGLHLGVAAPPDARRGMDLSVRWSSIACELTDRSFMKGEGRQGRVEGPSEERMKEDVVVEGATAGGQRLVWRRALEKRAAERPADEVDGREGGGGTPWRGAPPWARPRAFVDV